MNILVLGCGTIGSTIKNCKQISKNYFILTLVQYFRPLN